MSAKGSKPVRTLARIAYAVLLGLLGAGIVHIAVLLLLPSLSERNAWSLLGAAGGLNRFVTLGADSPAARLVRSADPLFEAAACRFDLGQGPVHVEAPSRTPFWSVSIYNRKGENIYSFNDRTATEGVLDLVLATPVQMLELKKELPPELEQSIVVEVDATDGIVVLRRLAPDATWRPLIADYLSNATCGVWR